MNSRFRSCAIGLVLAAALGGCQTAKPIAMSVSVTPTTKEGAAFGDVLAAQRKAGQDIPPLKGQQVLIVRSYEYVQKADEPFATSMEIEGIDCGVESEGYRASLKTPAEVRVPDYGYASRLISVRCHTARHKPSFVTVQPFDKTTSDRLRAGSNAGLAALVAVAIIDAATDKKTHEFSYPPAHVTMNGIGCETEKVGCR
ncbi:hypothetical protein [Bosea vaviloviae]|uniref:Lipoprotein n=1 Tax=Bosea vaviloviae TaxID=1526658 RepID=A0A1D7U2N0_9HYPH|nr:hypothetical protein [Bosea vaviloviae]AOO81639.1 hypothetical protein BHK69_15325 [Bosea vaviloviae]